MTRDGYDRASRREKVNKTMDELFPQQSSDQCRVCNEAVVDGRWNYCSERCREIANAVSGMFTWSVVREQILDRDDHTCQECGLSKERWWRAYRQIQERVNDLVPHPRRDDAGITFDQRRRARWHLKARYDVEAPARGGFHVDHIERVADGGHPLDESNLRTLCKYCHREKTAEENSGRGGPKPDITLEDYAES